MAVIDIDSLLEPVAPDDEAGPDLEYDPETTELFRIAAGTPERRMGDELHPAQDPDWRDVERRAVALLGRSKDLRVAVLLARAGLMLQGVRGLAAGLALTRGLLERYWSSVHPRVDPDDGDPTERVNSLLPLASKEALLDSLRTSTLVESRPLGAVSYRSVEIAEGRVSPTEDETAPDAATIAAIFKDCDIDSLAAIAGASADATTQLAALKECLGKELPAEQAPDLSRLEEVLSEIQTLLADKLAERGTMAEDSASVGDDEPAVATPTAANPAPPAARNEGIQSREDVVRMLERICDYYARNEPSSPVPLLLRRAQRLATGSFIEIVRDLAPDALKTIEQICGAEESA